MPRIRFIAIHAEKLAAATAVILVVLGVVSFLLLSRQRSTPIPRTVLLHAATAASTGEQPLPTAQVGAPAPDFTLSSADGKTVSLSAYRGRPVLLYFWASWCTFCRDDMPYLEKLYQEHAGDGLAVLAINVLESAAQVRDFGQRLGLSYPLLIDSKALTSQAYLVKATPTYIFIDSQGILRSQLVGRTREGILQANLAAILPQEPADQSGNQASR